MGGDEGFFFSFSFFHVKKKKKNLRDGIVMTFCWERGEKKKWDTTFNGVLSAPRPELVAPQPACTSDSRAAPPEPDPWLLIIYQRQHPIWIYSYLPFDRIRTCKQAWQCSCPPPPIITATYWPVICLMGCKGKVSVSIIHSRTINHIIWSPPARRGESRGERCSRWMQKTTNSLAYNMALMGTGGAL